MTVEFAAHALPGDGLEICDIGRLQSLRLRTCDHARQLVRSVALRNVMHVDHRRLNVRMAHIRLHVR